MTQTHSLLTAGNIFSKHRWTFPWLNLEFLFNKVSAAKKKSNEPSNSTNLSLRIVYKSKGRIWLRNLIIVFPQFIHLNIESGPDLEQVCYVLNPGIYLPPSKIRSFKVDKPVLQTDSSHPPSVTLERVLPSGENKQTNKQKYLGIIWQSTTGLAQGHIASWFVGTIFSSVDGNFCETNSWAPKPAWVYD